MEKFKRRKPDPKNKIQRKEIEEEKRNSISNTRMDPCSAAMSRGHLTHQRAMEAEASTGHGRGVSS